MAARRGYDVTIVERNDRMARKVMITGKGRCNVTNHCSVEECVAHIPGNGRFLYSALTAFSPQDTQELLESRGLRVAFTGKGAVREQTLPPGAKIQRGQTVTLKLR